MGGVCVWGEGGEGEGEGEGVAVLGGEEAYVGEGVRVWRLGLELGLHWCVVDGVVG